MSLQHPTRRSALLLSCALLLSAAASAQEAGLWPAEVQGSVSLSAPAVDPALVQGSLEGSFEVGSVTLEARSLLGAPARLGGAGEAVTALAAPGEWSGDYRLVVPPLGGALAVGAEVRFAGGATLSLPGVETPCLPRCVLSGGSATDEGCDPGCADCPFTCDTVPVAAGVDLATELAFVRFRFTHACLDLEINPTAATLTGFVDDGDGSFDAGLDAARAGLQLANPDTDPADGLDRFALELALPANETVYLSGRAELGTRSVDLLVVEDPRAPGSPLVLAPGELLEIAVGPVAGASLPPSHDSRPSDPRECDPPQLGAIGGSFSIAGLDELLGLELALTDGGSPGELSLSFPGGAPAEVPRWEITGLLPSFNLPAELAELDGRRYASSAWSFTHRPDLAGLPLARGRVGGLAGAPALLANDPPFDPVADCVFDALDPAAIALAEQAALVSPLASGGIDGWVSLNSPDHLACELFTGSVALDGDRRGLLTEVPPLLTTLRPARIDGLFRITDARLRDDGTLSEIGVEKALVLESFELGATTSLLSRGPAGAVAEAAEAGFAESVPARLDPGSLDADALDALRARVGMPGLEDPAALTEDDLVARGLEAPDLSIEDNRAALDASETYLRHEQLVALAANLPGPMTARSYSLRLRGEKLESPLGDEGMDVDGRLRIVDVTKPVHASAQLRSSALAGHFAASFPGPDFPSIAFPLELLADAEGLPAGTILESAQPGSELFLDPVVADGGFRSAETHANDGPDSTVDTEPTPDPVVDDNDAELDPTVARDPLLVKPDEDLSTRSLLSDRLRLEADETSIENFGACFGAVRLVLRAGARYRISEPSVTGRGHLNTEGSMGALAPLRPDLETDLNEDGVADQYLVLFDGEGEGFFGRRKIGRGQSAASVYLLLPAGDYVLEPHALLREHPTAEGRLTDFEPLEVSVGCGELMLLVAGDQACPLTQGFWKRQCGGPHPSGEDANLPLYVDFVNDLQSFAGVMDETALCDRMFPMPEEDKCEQAEAQLMAAALNLASDRVGPGAIVELPDLGDESPDVETAEELLAYLDELFASPDRTEDDCRLVQELADLFNRRQITPASAGCDSDVSDGDDGNDEGEGVPDPVDNSFKLWKTPEGLLMRWNDLPRGMAGSYEVVEQAFSQGVPPAEWVMDGLADVVLETATGELGETIPLPPGQLLFYKVRGLSPALGIPGPTRHRGR